MLIKYKFLKKNHMEQRIHINTLYVIRPSCVRLPQMTGYARKFNENATISFSVNNNKQLLKKLQQNMGKN